MKKGSFSVCKNTQEGENEFTPENLNRSRTGWSYFASMKDKQETRIELMLEKKIMRAKLYLYIDSKNKITSFLLQEWSYRF